jgi:hypothetical protein
MSLFDLIVQQYTLTTSELEEKWNGEHTNNQTPEQKNTNK